MGPPLKWWTAMKAAPVVCWETKRAFDHLGAHHFLMPLLKHDYGETFPLTLYVASSAWAPCGSPWGWLRHALWWENALRTTPWPQSSVTLPHVIFPARSRQAQPQFDQVHSPLSPKIWQGHRGGSAEVSSGGMTPWNQRETVSLPW